ncbi:hypothetical protein BRC97_06075 [Halobacteriales archaeon QS_6_71_20]|nr:MAG: hypothetical protein BRC97_06075 [Halobacteriales archaeon QS_6_71_20]
MSDDTGPREYDREWTVPIGDSARRRVAVSTESGEVVRFLVQLEYRHADGWRPVVRYDHDIGGSSEAAHDVTDEGLHIDIYRDSEKEATEFVTAPLPAGVALDHAEDHLAENLERYIRRYQEWHGIQNR